jgi:hypothetical protein
MPRTTRRVRSTQSVELPESPVEQSAVIGHPDSTDEEAFDRFDAVETRAPQLDAEFEVRSPTPEPVTMTVGWLSDENSFVVDAETGAATDTAGDSAEAKVVKPSKRSGPSAAKTKPETKSGIKGSA